MCLGLEVRDTTLLDVADTPENERVFGRPPGRRIDIVQAQAQAQAQARAQRGAYDATAARLAGRPTSE